MVVTATTRLSYWLHHLTDDTIAQNHGGVAILEGQLKGEIYEISHLLNTRRSQHDDLIVAITTTACSLELVTLRGLDRSQTGTATLNVHKHTRYLSTSHISDTLLHQSDTR